MAIQELRARIMKLDTEIGLQRELLKKLQRDKSLAQRQLNAVVDPVARLPLEIASDIFLRTLAPLPLEPGAPHPPMLLLNICHAWSDIAIATPALWTAIHIIFPCATGVKDFLPIWLERSRNRPLSVLLEGKFDQDVVSVIWRHGQQLRHLEICEAEKGEEDTDQNAANGLMELWGATTSPGPLPSLVTLTIRDSMDRASEFTRISPFHIFELLRLAPNLVECLFCDTDIVFAVGADQKLVLPNLRRLMFGEQGRYPSFDHNILDSLSLPGLEALSITVNTDHLLSFLKRSSPALQELVLAHESDFLSLAECLRFAPDLKQFELQETYYSLAEELFGALIESASLLPQLSILIINLTDNEDPEISYSFWNTALGALVARRTQLLFFRLTIPILTALEMPTPDIIAAFRELVADGMQVHIIESVGARNILG
ncbi:hypothetical protein B0H14DRAFT_2724858 [Mycena olivaceomarginata]|nr:hypothetical protein B0H14DRAFT_2724858 [Mycena olivaceomarginata]